jgi:DnaJ-class molecular chaperone
LAQDPYRELGVTRSASADEIRKAFRKLAKIHHPDANPGKPAAEEKFKQISGAFDILGDPEKRRKFDAGEMDADGRETARAYGGSPFGQGGPGAGRGASFDGVDLNDILGEMFGGRGGGGPRGGMGGGMGGGFGGGFASKGADVRAKLDIDLEEAVAGGKRRLSFSDGRTLDVTIPKGATEGQVLRLRGQGSPGRAGAGDALIEIAIRPHPIWRREGDKLVMDLPVSVPDAVLGAKVEAETPDGVVTLTVPKGSNSGATLRLRGRGLPNGQGGRGDLLARIMITLPEVQDEDLECLAEAWRRQRPYTAKRRS